MSFGFAVLAAPRVTFSLIGPEVLQASFVYRAVTRLTFVQIVACSEANGRACAQIDAPGGARRAGEEIQVDLERGSSPGVPPGSPLSSS